VKVRICAYGAGNVLSVTCAFARMGVDVAVTDEPGEVLEAGLAVLPGVGSAASAMAGLQARGLDEALRERVSSGRPTFGICLGLQLALDGSEEDGGVQGLGLVPGRAVRLCEGRVPRIGWAPVDPLDESFYFAHSYVAQTPATTATSEGLAAEVRSGSFLGVQFHPEKSGAAGARYLVAVLDECRSLV
jgi:imidazole glycerol phosphate synthase glutamine amidotransferase subunit